MSNTDLNKNKINSKKRSTIRNDKNEQIKIIIIKIILIKNKKTIINNNTSNHSNELANSKISLKSNDNPNIFEVIKLMNILNNSQNKKEKEKKKKKSI